MTATPTASDVSAKQFEGKNISYAAKKSSVVEGSAPMREFKVLSIEKEGVSESTLLPYFVAQVVDLDDGDSIKYRTFHFDGVIG